MKRKRTLNLLSSIIIVGSVLLMSAGCSNENSSPPNSTPTATQSTNDADNTAKNQRDQTNATLTPGDQGNSDADRAITQKIRQAVVRSTNNFSVTAQNIKIITVDGNVTLRGPVNTDSEKAGIEGIARAIAGDGKVDDQLEVKSNQ